MKKKDVMGVIFFVLYILAFVGFCIFMLASSMESVVFAIVFGLALFAVGVLAGLFIDLLLMELLL